MYIEGMSRCNLLQMSRSSDFLGDALVADAKPRLPSRNLEVNQLVSICFGVNTSVVYTLISNMLG